MKHAAILIVLGLLCSAPAVRASVGYAVGDTAADLIAPDQNGAAHRLSEYAGKWVLLDVCAAWSKPCRIMASDAQSIYDDWSRRPGISFEYLSCLSQGPSFLASTRGDAVNWANQLGPGRPVLHDDGTSGSVIGWMAAAGLVAIPTQVIVGPDGVIREIHAGYRSPQEIAADLGALTGLVAPTVPPSPASLEWERIRHSLPHDPR